MSWSPGFRRGAAYRPRSLISGGKDPITWSSPKRSFRNWPRHGAPPYWQARYSPAEAADAIALLRADAIVAPLTVQITGVATHPEDDLILATAVSSGAAYLVTGDRRLRAVGAFQGVTLLSPREFSELLAAGEIER